MNATPLWAATALIALLMCSCASGPGFEETRVSGALAPRPGKAKVLIYRTPGMAGAASKPFLFANGRLLPGQLARGSFYAYDAEPGTLNLAYSWRKTESVTGQDVARNAVGGLIAGGPVGAVVGLAIEPSTHQRHGITFPVQPGETHYVEMDGRDLHHVSRREGQEAIADCRLLNPGS